MKIIQMIVIGPIDLALGLAVACSASQPPEEVAEEMEGVFVEAPDLPANVTMHRGGPVRTGVYDTAGVLETPEAKWVFQADRAIVSSAAVMDGKVLFGSDDGLFYALDIETGKPVWTVETGRQVRTSPLVADGVVYFGADDSFMTAVNLADGEVVWRTEVQGIMRSSPVISGGTLFFGTDIGSFYSIDARTGLLNREAKLTPRYIVRSSPAAVEDTIVVADTEGRPPFTSNLIALDRSTADELWRYAVEGWSQFPLAVGDGAVFFSTAEGAGAGENFRWSDGRLYAVELSSGEQRWMVLREGVGAFSPPALTEDFVLFGWQDGRFEALDVETGNVEWQLEVGSSVFGAPSVADGLVYFGTADGTVTAVDIVNGQKRWEFQTELEGEICRLTCFGIRNAPAISNGVLYIGNGAGYFYALESPDSESP